MSINTGLDLTIDLSGIIILVIGGTTFKQKGKPLGILTGLIVFGFLKSGLILLGIPSYFHMLLKGLVFLFFIFVNNRLYNQFENQNSELNIQ